MHKAVHAIDNKVDIQRNKIFHLEDSMVMYGIYNSDTLEDLIDTVHKLHNRTTWNEKLFSGKIDNWYNYYSSSSGVQHYVITGGSRLSRIFWEHENLSGLSIIWLIQLL